MTTLNINGQRVTVSDSFLQLSPQEQERTVEEIAASLPSGNSDQPDQIRPSGAMRPFALFNEGVARMGDAVGGPVGWLVNRGLEAVGVPEQYRLSEAPGHGLMDSVGINTASPENWLESGVVGAGEAAGMMAPIGATAQALSRGSGVAAGVGRTMMEPFARTPLTGLAAEVGSGAGARIAGDAAQQSAPDNPWAQIGAEMAGAVAGGGAPYLMRAMPSAVGARAVGRYIAREATPFTERGARGIAGERLRQLAADPDRAMQRLEEPTLSGLTPAQRTGEPSLMALERTIAERDPALRESLDTAAEQAQDSLRDQIGSIGERPEAARSFFAHQIEMARQAAAAAVERVAPRQRQGAIAGIVREELESAYETARMRERAIWEQIPRTVQVPTDQTRAALERLIERTGRARQGDIPPVARAFFEGRESGPEAWFEMHDLYSALRQYAREQSGGMTPNDFRASNANAIADAILRDIETVGGAGQVGQLTREAIDFSREMHRAFTQGTVGRVMGRTRAGGDAVSPEMALDTALSSGGTRGSVGAREIQRAAEFNNEYQAAEGVRGSMEDFILGRFVGSTVRDGRIRPSAAATFTRENAELLDQYPGVRNATETATQVERFAGSVETSVGAVFAATPEGQEFARTVFAPGETNPARRAAALRRQAGADPTGAAVAGLKGAAVDFLIGAGTRNGRLSGTALSAVIRDHERALLQILNEAELNRLRRVATEMNSLEQSRRSGSLSSIVDRRPNRLISYILRVQAAGLGASHGRGGASIQTAQMASGRMQELLVRLTEGRAAALLRDAITDPELMRSLFEDYGRSPAATRRVEGRLTEWLQGYAATQVSTED